MHQKLHGAFMAINNKASRLASYSQVFQTHLNMSFLENLDVFEMWIFDPVLNKAIIYDYYVLTFKHNLLSSLSIIVCLCPPSVPTEICSSFHWPRMVEWAVIFMAMQRQILV